MRLRNQPESKHFQVAAPVAPFPQFSEEEQQLMIKHGYSIQDILVMRDLKNAMETAASQPTRKIAPINNYFPMEYGEYMRRNMDWPGARDTR